jgi:type II secretory pathway pseudopilin PulG
MNTNTHTSPKDFFLHLGATVALYASVIAFINLAFEIANRALPDALASYYSANSVVWPISMLVVLVPVLYVLEKLINRDISRLPEKREIWIRKWRIYLTLFLTGVTIAVDIIVLINTYLNGEISSRFIWKVLVVMIVSVVVFAYYILAKNESIGTKKTWLTILAVLGIVLVLIGIVSGFIIVGSPSTQRAMRFDGQRVNDLSNIQYQITNYWQRTGNLPENLLTLNDPISSFSVPMDPETLKPYEYSVNKLSSKSPWTFDLCATFSLSSYGDDATFTENSRDSLPTKPVSRSIVGGNLNETWIHTAGHNCFERVIDPKLYPSVTSH